MLQPRQFSRQVQLPTPLRVFSQPQVLIEVSLRVLALPKVVLAGHPCLDSDQKARPLFHVHALLLVPTLLLFYQVVVVHPSPTPMLPLLLRVAS